MRRCCRGRGQEQNDLISGLCSKVELDICPDDNRKERGFPPHMVSSNFPPHVGFIKIFFFYGHVNS